MLTESKRDERRDRREAWCATRAVGDPTATFYPGQEIRCPGTRHLNGGAKRVCGATFDNAKPYASSKVVVHVRQYNQTQPECAGIEKHCRDCHSNLILCPYPNA